MDISQKLLFNVNMYAPIFKWASTIVSISTPQFYSIFLRNCENNRRIPLLSLFLWMHSLWLSQTWTPFTNSRHLFYHSLSTLTIFRNDQYFVYKMSLCYWHNHFLIVFFANYLLHLPSNVQWPHYQPLWFNLKFKTEMSHIHFTVFKWDLYDFFSVCTKFYLNFMCWERKETSFRIKWANCK